MSRKTILSSRQRWSGRQSAALLLLAVGMALTGILTGTRAHANPNQVIGLDMTPTSVNTPAASGVDTCVQVAVGDSFEADVFATNLSSLTAYEFRIDFDPNVLSLDYEAIDYNFLLAKDGGSAQFSLRDEEKPGRWFIGAADTAHPDSGSGTLARLRFDTLKKGTSTLTIAANPVYLRPILQGALAVSVGDDNGDGYWDGGLSAGKVAVGESCAGSTPIVTPAPTHVPNNTPKPGSGSSTPAPTGSGEPNGGNGGSGDGENGSGGGDTGSGPEESSPPIVGNVEPGDAGETGDNGAPGNVQDPGDISGGQGRDPNQSGSGGSSNTSLIALAVVAATLAVAAGGTLAWLRLATSRR